MRRRFDLSFDSLQTDSLFSFHLLHDRFFVIVLSYILPVKLTILSFWLRNRFLNVTAVFVINEFSDC